MKTILPAIGMAVLLGSCVAGCATLANLNVRP